MDKALPSGHGSARTGIGRTDERGWTSECGRRRYASESSTPAWAHWAAEQPSATRPATAQSAGFCTTSKSSQSLITRIGVLRTGGCKGTSASCENVARSRTPVRVHLMPMDDVADDVAITHDTRDRDRLTVKHESACQHRRLVVPAASPNSARVLLNEVFTAARAKRTPLDNMGSRRT